MAEWVDDPLSLDNQFIYRKGKLEEVQDAIKQAEKLDDLERLEFLRQVNLPIAERNLEAVGFQFIYK